MDLQNTTHKTRLYEKCLEVLSQEERKNLYPNFQNQASLAPFLDWYKINDTWYSKSTANSKSVNFLFPLEDYQYILSKTQRNSGSSRKKEYNKILQTKQKLSLFYGYLSTKKIKNLIKEAQKFPGYFSKNFFSLIEQRIDVVLYRSGLVPSILAARQLCLHEKVLLNSQYCVSSSTLLKPGDIISIPSLAFDLQSEDNNRIASLKNKGVITSPITQKKKKSLLRCNHYLQNLDLYLEDIQEKKKNLSFTFSDSIYFLLQALKRRYSRQKRYLSLSPSLQLEHKKETISFFTEFQLKFKDKAPTLFQKSEKDQNQDFQSILESNSIYLFISQFINLSPIFKKQLQYYLKKKEIELNLFSLSGQNQKQNYKSNTGFKGFKYQTVKKREYKPLHIEVSKSIGTFIYLYSPQRIKLPFTIDMDTIKKLTRI
jgi:ribosomal protein S4